MDIGRPTTLSMLKTGLSTRHEGWVSLRPFKLISSSSRYGQKKDRGKNRFDGGKAASNGKHQPEASKAHYRSTRYGYRFRRCNPTTNFTFSFVFNVTSTPFLAHETTSYNPGTSQTQSTDAVAISTIVERKESAPTVTFTGINTVSWKSGSRPPTRNNTGCVSSFWKAYEIHRGKSEDKNEGKGTRDLILADADASVYGGMTLFVACMLTRNY